MFEKCISGMYLGEISRNAILSLVDRYLLFDGRSSKELNKQWGFETAYMSTIEADNTPELDTTKDLLEQTLSLGTTTLADRQIVKKICEIVGTRAARLSAAAIGSVISHTGVIEAGCSVGIDGSLFENYPNFADRIKDALRELFGSNVDKIELGLAQDGSGVGAGKFKIFAHCSLGLVKDFIMTR